MLQPFKDLKAQSFETCWRSPANIAFIKYWGKKGHQLPANPSLSMTLKECFTETKMSFSPAASLSVELYLDNKREDRFAVKIEKYLQTLSTELPFLKSVSVSIETKNTFPHGAGIASSASGLSAVALGLTDYLYQKDQSEQFYKTASYLSRLASGSACRSVYGGYTTWGQSELSGSSDEFASTLKVHTSLEHLRDSVLVISEEEKAVSSRAGHDRMVDHPFAAARFEQAKRNFSAILPAMKNGDLEVIGSILEMEALSLHAMMLTSGDGFILMRPNTIPAIERLRAFRQDTKIPLYFTLDAGPNLHLIYPPEVQSKVQAFIDSDLRELCSNVIHDEVGSGPKPC
jgi:diphosphomevalonate decarboxylase